MNPYRLARASSRLRALRANLPPGAYVTERFVQEYNRILEDELSAEARVEEFHLDPEFEVRPCPEDREWPVNEEALATPCHRGSQFVVHRTSFVVKLDAALGYLDVLKRWRSAVNGDKLIRARSRAVALKENLPPGSYVAERFVREYHEILRYALPPGYGVAELHLHPEYEVRKIRRSDSENVDELDLSPRGRILVHRASFLMKVDAVLRYVDALALQSPTRLKVYPQPTP